MSDVKKEERRRKLNEMGLDIKNTVEFLLISCKQFLKVHKIEVKSAKK